MAKFSLSKFIAGAAQGGAQVLDQQMKANIMKERDERLNSFDVQARKSNQQFQADQNTLDRDIQSRRLDISEEQLELNREQAEKVAQQIDQELQTGEIQLEQAQQLKDIREQIISTQDPQEQQTLYEKYLNIQGKEPDNKFRFIRLDNEFDEDTIIRGNTQSGEFEVLDMSGGSASQFSMSEQQAIQEILRANPDKDAAWARAYLQYLQSGG